MHDDDALEVVREAIIWAKSEVVDLAPGQVTLASILSEPPICLDSLEAIAMVTRLEEELGLVAEDEHFFACSVRTVGDVVASVEKWVTTVQLSQQ